MAWHGRCVSLTEAELVHTSEQALNALFLQPPGRNQIPFNEFWIALAAADVQSARTNVNTIAEMELALDRMELANEVMHREGLIHLI